MKRPLRRRLRRLGRMARNRARPSTWVAAVWAYRALEQVRRELPSGGIATRCPAPPALPADRLRSVEAVMQLRNATCLQRCLVLQAWLLAHGQAHDIVIGVPRPGEDFQAHAWLADWRHDAESEDYKELTRIPASA